jgi:zinc protease
VRQPLLARSYLAPQRKPGDQREAAALEVLAQLLGGSGITSVMAQALQIGEDVAIDTGAGYSDVGVDTQNFTVFVAPKPGTDPAEAEARLDALIDRFLEEGPNPAQLERVKSRMQAAEIYALDNQNRRARQIGAALASGLTLEDVADWPDLLQQVTAEDVADAARVVFRPEASVTAWMLAPEPDGVPEAVEAVGQ